jgi:hypothetical protein
VGLRVQTKVNYDVAAHRRLGGAWPPGARGRGREGGRPRKLSIARKKSR